MSITTGPIVWAAPYNIIFFPAVLLAWFFIIRRSKKVKRAIEVLSNKHAKTLFPQYSARRDRIKNVFMCLGVLALFFSLLRPQWRSEKETRQQEGRDLFFVLDISRSMLATDAQPDRLTVAKKKIAQLVAQLACERVGLILFSGSAFVQCPLTSDMNAFLMFLDQIDVETISSGSTALDQALAVAIDVFKRMPERKNKLAVIFTDGEDFSSNLASSKQEAQQLGMHIITASVGTAQGAPIPLYDGHGNQEGHQTDEKGNIVISRVNEGILRNLAADCGGVFVAHTADESDVNAIKKYVYSFERERLASSAVDAMQERYYYGVIMSFVCLALAWLL